LEEGRQGPFFLLPTFPSHRFSQRGKDGRQGLGVPQRDLCPIAPKAIE